MRSRFDEQLEQLNIKIIEMGSLCEQVINRTYEVLINEDQAANIAEWVEFSITGIHKGEEE